MGKYILLIICIGSYSLSFSQRIKAKTYIENPKGKRKTIKIEEFDTSGNLVLEKECVNNNCSKFDGDGYVFNKENQLIADSAFTNKYGYHSLILEYEYTYYLDGNLKTEKALNKDCQKGFDDFNTFYYNSESQLVKIYNENACDNSNYSNYPIHYKYDENGLLVEKLAKYYDTTIIWYKNVYKYDSKNNLISDTYYYRENGTLEFSSVRSYSYDSQNNLISKVWGFGDFADSTTYSYYPNGLLKTETNHPRFSDDSLTWIEHSYNSEKQLISKQLYYFNDKGKKKKGWFQVVKFEYY